jgi:hypothetical protein
MKINISLLFKLLVMPTLTIQKMLPEKRKPCLLCLPGCYTSNRTPLNFDPEFSIPAGFFDKELLETCHRCEPDAKEKMQTNNIRH